MHKCPSVLIPISSQFPKSCLEHVPASFIAPLSQLAPDLNRQVLETNLGRWMPMVGCSRLFGPKSGSDTPGLRRILLFQKCEPGRHGSMHLLPCMMNRTSRRLDQIYKDDDLESKLIQNPNPTPRLLGPHLSRRHLPQGGRTGAIKPSQGHLEPQGSTIFRWLVSSIWYILIHKKPFFQTNGVASPASQTN